MRFLLCLGVEPDLVEPGKRYHKPFVERSIRALKYECLWLERPSDWLDAAGILEVYANSTTKIAPTNRWPAATAHLTKPFLSCRRYRMRLTWLIPMPG
jgi:hypothetical protein